MKLDFDNVEHEQFARFYHHDQRANSTARSATDIILMKAELFVSGYATWSEKAKLFSSGYATWSGKHEQFENVYHHDQRANSAARSSTDIMLVKPDFHDVEHEQFAKFYHHDQNANSTARSATDIILVKPNFDNVEHEQFAKFYHHDQKAISTARSSTDIILMKAELFSSGYATWSGEPEL